MQRVAKVAIDNVSKKVRRLLADQIDKDVYKSHGPNSVYYAGNKEPTGQFKDEAWGLDPATEKGVRKVIAALYYKPAEDDVESIAFNGSTWLHGSNIEGWGDARSILASILNQDTKLSSLWMTVDRGSDHRFWENFLDELFDNGKLEQFFLEEFRRMGFVVQQM